MKFPEKRYAQGVRPAHIFFPEVQVIFLRGILSPSQTEGAGAFPAKVFLLPG
jgi:hypothetical protein